MKKICLLALALSGPSLLAPSPVEIESLRKELSELRQKARELEEKLNRFETAKPAGGVVPTKDVHDHDHDHDHEHARSAADPHPHPHIEGNHDRDNDHGPFNLIHGKAGFLNLGLGASVVVGSSAADDLEILQPGEHDPNQRGFTLQAIEATFDGRVYNYFGGHANILFQVDREGEGAIEVEEAWAQTLNLPADLSLRAGLFLTDFGRHNSTHLHSWQFVDSPLANARLLGGHGLRGLGLRGAWLGRKPFLSEFSLGIQNSRGESAHSFRSSHDGAAYLGRLHNSDRLRQLDDLLVTPRYWTEFDLTDSQILVLGTSASFGPNGSGGDVDTQLYGADIFWRWTAPGGSFVAWQSEGILRRYEAGAFDGDLDGDGANDPAPGETLRDYGFYTQVIYGFRKGWAAGLRLDYVNRLERAQYELTYGDDPDRAERWRLSPNITWSPSHASKIRLQYNFDDRKGVGPDHSVWLQFEYMLGAHGAHGF